MTLILELTPEEEAQLNAEAAQNGIDTKTYARKKLLSTGVPAVEPKSFAQRLAEHGILGAVEGKPRKDGRNWSEIEGFPDDLG